MTQSTAYCVSSVVSALLKESVLFPSQRFPTDKAYFIAKELLTTERTYLKDLEVVTVVRPITR